jgi:transcriptional regulator with XRE-family HTH domain
MRYDRAIARILESTKISQAELARRCELSAPYVSQLVSGEREPSPATVRLIGAAVSIPPSLIALLGAEEGELRGLTVKCAREIAEALLKLAVANEKKRSEG